MLINVNNCQFLAENNEISYISDSGAYFQNIISDEILNVVVYPVIVVKAFG
jgi:hypothetical protein